MAGKTGERLRFLLPLVPLLLVLQCLVSELLKPLAVPSLPAVLQSVPSGALLLLRRMTSLAQFAIASVRPHWGEVLPVVGRILLLPSLLTTPLPA